MEYIWAGALPDVKSNIQISRLQEAFSRIRKKTGSNPIEEMLRKTIGETRLSNFTELKERWEEWLIREMEGYPECFSPYPLYPLGAPEEVEEGLLDKSWDYLLSRTASRPEEYSRFLYNIFHIEDEIIVKFIMTIFRCLNSISPQEKRMQLIKNMAEKSQLPWITLATLYLWWQKAGLYIPADNSINMAEKGEMEDAVNEAVAITPFLRRKLERTRYCLEKIQKLHRAIHLLESAAKAILPDKRSKRVLLDQQEEAQVYE
jgi:hypothetical protein